jgi:uroporphyrinogen III methyltransferase/synthase
MPVYLVGAGPGDPGLLTVRGSELLRRADVIVHDRRSAASLLDLAPPGAERISVDRTGEEPAVSQAEINELLVDRGRADRRVVRLHPGDPFVFAPGREECQALADAGVAYEVVPGVTAAVAAPAYAGIPVTTGPSSDPLTLLAGPGDHDGEGSVDWPAVARLGGTIVVLPGTDPIGVVADRLLAAGRPSDTPVAAVRWGTRPEQRTLRATLGTVADEDVAAPSAVVIGEAALHELDWFERRPLFGLAVVVTRPVHQAATLMAALGEAGAAAVAAPAIIIEDPADGGAALQRAALRLADYDWIVLTSANGAQRLLAELRDARAFGGARVAAIGPGTAAALREANVEADLVPDEYVAEHLLAALPDPPPGGGRLLLARAAVARDVLPDGLRERGWAVDVVEVYRTGTATLDPSAEATLAGADVITFTSSSTVTRHLEQVGGSAAVGGAVACIGPVTAATARDAGLAVAVEAPVHTVAGLVDALVAWRSHGGGAR